MKPELKRLVGEIRDIDPDLANLIEDIVESCEAEEVIIANIDIDQRPYLH